MAHIVSVCRVYPTQRPGGMPFVVADRAEELVRQGHKVTVLTTGMAGTGAHERTVRGVRVMHLPCAPEVYSNQFADACETATRKLRPDILHLDSTDFDRPWWPQVRSYPVAITLHGFYMGDWLTELNMANINHKAIPAIDTEKLRRQVKVLDGLVDFVLAISLHEYRLLASCYNVRESKLRLVYNPIASIFFEDPTEPDRSNRKFMCAAISGHKKRGFEFAVAGAAKAGVELVVAQDTARSDMPSLLDTCRGFIIPTNYAQGFDLTFAESLARFRPVICTTAGSYFDESERLLSSGAVIRVSMGSSGQIADAISDICENPTRFFVPSGAADRHRPENHVSSWLRAVGL